MRPSDGATISDFFSPFGEDEISRCGHERTPDEREELDRMFEVTDVRNELKSDFVISTSLYCQPHDAEKERLSPLTLETLQKRHPSVRNGSSWWAEYFLPLTQQFDCVREPWSVRLYLAPDLLFLEPYLRHPRVELRIMNHISVNTIPGMLWRYLPLEDGVTMVARGADAFVPTSEILQSINRMIEGPNLLFRHFLPRDVDGGGFIVYRAVPGPIVMKGCEGLGFTEAAKAWIWHQRRGLWPLTVQMTNEDGRPVDAKKFGMTHWARYGQDEQFLSHWLYHIAAREGIHSTIPRNHRSKLWDLDLQYVTAANVSSVVEYV